MQKKLLSFVGYASGLAANNPGCGDAPIQLKDRLIEKLLTAGIESYWQVILALQANSTKKYLTQVVELNTRLAETTRDLTERGQPFVVVGGDHSSAIGTWSGVSSVNLGAGNALGLIWIDAHMDSHTFATTPSGNIHGMPLAALLGYGDVALTQILTALPKLQPEHVSLIGIRSFESEEAALLRRVGVRIYEMPEVKQRGLSNVLEEAIVRAKKNTIGFGVSLDLDAIDPKDAPGVGVPEPDGIAGGDLCEALTLLQQEKQLLGLEIVEYNPYLDKNNKTEQLIYKILLSIFGD